MKEKERNLLYHCLLSESLIIKIERFHGYLKKVLTDMKSVQSKKPCKSVIQTIYDIVKDLGVE